MIKRGIKKLARMVGLSSHLSTAADMARRIGPKSREQIRRLKRRATVLRSRPFFDLKSTISPYSRPLANASGRGNEFVGRPRLPYQVDYSRHPAFVEHLICDRRYDHEIDCAVDSANKLLLDLEAALTMKRIELPEAAKRTNESIRPVTELLIAANQAAGANFRPFAARFHLETLRVLLDDLAYFERRNSYVPVIQNATELALRNELAVKGFLEFDLNAGELATLQTHVKKYADLLDSRYRRGGRSREELSTNQIEPMSSAMMSDLFGLRGLNKAVSDVLHERAEARSFAVELSVDDSDWWHSRYEDVGLLFPNKSAYFHTDEGRSIYKAIIYLTDADEELGPFCYVPETFAMERPRFDWAVARATLTTLLSPEIRSTMTDMHPSRGVFTSRVARRFFGMLPARLRLNSHFGFDVLDDSQLSTLLQSQEVRMTGRAGHAIVFDGSRIVHRGGLVRKGKRLALQVVFGVRVENGVRLFTQMRHEFEDSLYVC